MPNFRKLAQLYRELADELDNEAVADAGEFETRYDVNEWPSDANAPQDDPWASDPQPSRGASLSESRPRQGQVSSNRGNGGGQGQSGGSGGRSSSHVPTQGTFTDDRGKSWTFGKYGAPSCDHNMAAALVTGQKPGGKAWKAWACPLGYGDSWRDKCELFQFTR